MKKSIIALIFLCFFGCDDKDAKSQALEFFQKGSTIFERNPENKDSLLYALKFIESAIKLDSTNTRFHLAATRMYLNLKLYDMVINKCDGILLIDKNNYFASLTKGVAFELNNNLDSSKKIFKETLDILEKTKFQTRIYKDHQRIVLLGLLNDSVDFQLKLKEFHKTHFSNSQFDAYYSGLINFNKAEYLSNY